MQPDRVIVIIAQFAHGSLREEQYVLLKRQPCLLYSIHPLSDYLILFLKQRQEVVGEIYDEDDNEEYAVDSRDISR